MLSTRSEEIKVGLCSSELLKGSRQRQQLVVPAVLEAVGGLLLQEQFAPCLRAGR